MNLVAFIEERIRDFLGDPGKNSLGQDANGANLGKAWTDFLIGFSSGSDQLYGEMKEHIGTFHWTPREAFLMGFPSAEVSDEELTVVSWALSHTEATKLANRRETFFPSEHWARARIFGQKGNRSLAKSLIQGLTAGGHPSVAPTLLPEFSEAESRVWGQASSWSERHAAYISGLGTFGLCGGLITAKGQAVRLGSLIVRAKLPATDRQYDDPFAYCLYHMKGKCGVCAKRCPVSSVTPTSRNKRPCAHHLQPVTADHVRGEYGFDGYGCGLCQTGVPCESGIPKALRRQLAEV